MTPWFLVKNIANAKFVATHGGFKVNRTNAARKDDEFGQSTGGATTDLLNQLSDGFAVLDQDKWNWSLKPEGENWFKAERSVNVVASEYRLERSTVLSRSTRRSTSRATSGCGLARHRCDSPSVGCFWLGTNLTDTVVTRKDHSLVTTGPYRYVRHPFYLAFFIAIIGGSIVTANWYLFVTSILPFAFLVARTRIEEQKLVERFGDEYRDYMQKTGRFWPRSQ